jgi:hypothetical protein
MVRLPFSVLSRHGDRRGFFLVPPPLIHGFVNPIHKSIALLQKPDLLHQQRTQLFILGVKAALKAAAEKQVLVNISWNLLLSRFQGRPPR